MGEPVRQAGAGLTAGMESDAVLRLGEANGPPNPRQGHLRQALGEDPGGHLGMEQRKRRTCRSR
jgi:hypothetical protein